MNTRQPLISTYSIIACDKQAGQMGVAVQSHYFSVGSAVPWGLSGVGMVATQAMANVKFGPDGLALLQTGKTPDQALVELLGSDEGAELRQVALLSAAGEVAVHTGKRCIGYASHVKGSGFAAQANMMHKPGIPEAMAEAYLSESGTLARRLEKALLSAEKAGGDIRGKQSAAILICNTQKTNHPAFDKKLDLRIEDNPEPLAELNRLLTIREAYDAMDRGDNLLEKGDKEGAFRAFNQAGKILPDSDEIKFWHGVTFLNLGKEKEAGVLFKPLFKKDSRWYELLLRLPETGLGEYTITMASAFEPK